MNRVDDCINNAMERHPGTTKAALAAYYADVHQHLAPLAHELEDELDRALARVRDLNAENFKLRGLTKG